MGKKNQHSNRFFRLFDNKLEKANVACILVNKMYTNVGADKWEPKFISCGGVSMEYNPSITLTLERVAESNYLSKTDYQKEKDKRSSTIGASLVTIKCTVSKSRFGTYGRRVIIAVDFATGLIRKSGLFDIVKDNNLITQSGAYYKFNDEKLYSKSFYRKDFEGLITDDMLLHIEDVLHKKEKEMRDNEEIIMTEEDVELEENERNMLKAIEKDEQNLDK